eukprot:8749467-Pyramimonas_sp.AAC.1
MRSFPFAAALLPTPTRGGGEAEERFSAYRTLRRLVLFVRGEVNTVQPTQWNVVLMSIISMFYRNYSRKTVSTLMSQKSAHEFTCNPY